MRLRILQNIFLSLFIFLPLLDQAAAQEKQTYQSLQHALFSGSQLRGDTGPQNIQWIEGGNRFSYMTHDLMSGERQIYVSDPSGGEDELIFDTAGKTFPNSDLPFEFSSFEWSADFEYLVFQTNFRPIYRYSGNSDYYYYSLEDESLRLVARDAFTARLSPDGSKIGYHKDGDMYVYNLDEETETRLTTTAGEYFFNGRFGWVYEEEFGLVEAWQWSPDSRYIAYWQTDERDVEHFVSTDYEGTYPQYTDIPYPKTGSENPKVRLAVVDTERGRNRWLDLDPGDGLVPRIYWTARPNTLAVVWMNRQQSEMELHLFDAANGQGEMIYRYADESGWVDVFDFFAGIDHYLFFPKDSQEFFLISDRDGYKHLYRYGYDGELINQVTSGDWRVTNVMAIDEQTEKIYYISTEVSPLERHLYSISFDGSGKRRLSQSEGTHSFSMGQNGRYYIDRWNNTEDPGAVELWTTEDGGRLLHVYSDNERVREFTNRYIYQPRELFSFTTSDGQELDGYLVKPHDFDSTATYPLLLNIYGGPGAQGVYNQFETDAWTQYLAQEGFVIANVNNRGSGGYSRDFEKAVYLNLGTLEAHDFAETARYLGSKEWIDSSRMAIRGHSYGGYMAALTVVLHPSVFKASIVGAPVADWRLYDTIYTERYMGLLEENEENYIKSSVMAHASKLQANMLIAHSSMDENVHIQNTMQMLTAFINAGKDVDLRIFPKGAHGVAYNQQSYLLLHQAYTNYLNRHLK